MVEAFFIQQFLVGALLHDLAIVNHQHVVGIPDGAEAVGNDKAGAAGHQAQQSLLDARLGARVHAAGGFVQDQDRGIGQDGTRDREQLALSLAEIAGAFREQGIVTLRQLADEMIGVGYFGGRDHLFVSGIQPAETDILHDRVREQESVLQDQAEFMPQVVFADLADIFPIDGDPAGIDLVETRQQVDDGGLAGPGRADQGKDLPGLGLQGHVL